MSGIDGARVDASVWELQPGYEVLLVEARGLQPGPSDAASEQVLAAAEARAAERVAGRELTEVPELAAWRTAYRSFGAKPQRTRPSVEALIRRLDGGLPRVDRLTDAYNAVSIGHLLPIGGENLDAYDGSPVLTRAAGGEPFDTVAGGEPAVEAVDAGEVVWRDDAGVTCRRWNWRQCVRTRLTTDVTRALFILDWLPADDDTQSSLAEAGSHLHDVLVELNPGVELTSRRLTGASS